MLPSVLIIIYAGHAVDASDQSQSDGRDCVWPITTLCDVCPELRESRHTAACHLSVTPVGAGALRPCQLVSGPPVSLCLFPVGT